MQFHQISLNGANGTASLLQILIENNVDFKIINGINPNGNVRVGAIVNLSTPVRINFGDKKHGNLITRIHDASDHRNSIKLDDFLSELLDYEVTSEWSSGKVKQHEEA